MVGWKKEYYRITKNSEALYYFPMYPPLSFKQARMRSGIVRTIYCVVFLTGHCIFWGNHSVDSHKNNWYLFMLAGPSFLFKAFSLITYNYLKMWPLAIDLKNGGHDGKRWFIGINSFLTGPVIISNKNRNSPIKWEVIISFWNSAIICWRETPSSLPFLLCSRELCL